MRISKITLNNFGLFPKAIIEANDVKVFVINGHNGSGKTLLRNSLEWLLPGTARRMSKPNDRLSEKDLIRIGESKATGEMLFLHSGKEYKIIKTVTASTNGIQIYEAGQLKKFQDAEGSPRNPEQSDIWEILGVDYNQLMCLFDARRILDMSEAERKQFYFLLSGIKVTEPLLREIFPIHGIVDPQLSPLIEKIQADKFEGAKSWAVEQRVKAKRNKTDLLKILAPKDEKVTYKSNNLQLYQIGLEMIQQDIKALDEQNNELQTRKGSLKVLADIDVMKLHQEIAELNGEITEIEKYLKSYQSVSEIEAKLAEQRNQMEQLHIDENEVNDKIKPQAIVVDRLSEKIKSFKVLKDKCPTCDQPIQGDYLPALIEPLEKELQSEQNKLKELQSQQMVVFTQQSELIKTIKSNDKLIPELQGKEKDLARAKKTVEEKQHIVKEKGTQAVKAREEMKSVAANLEKIVSAKTILNGLKSKVEMYQKQDIEYKEAQAKIKTVNQEIEYYNKLDKLLDPAGPVITEIVSQVIGKVQERLDFLNSFELIDPIKFNPDWTFSIGDRTEFHIDKDSSEWTRISFILSETVAYFLKGLGLFVADGIDIMLPDLKVKFQSMIEGIMDDYESMFIFGSRTKPFSLLTEKELEKVEMNIPSKPGWKYFWLENGQVYDLEKQK